MTKALTSIGTVNSHRLIDAVHKWLNDPLAALGMPRGLHVDPQSLVVLAIRLRTAGVSTSAGLGGCKVAVVRDEYSLP
jgi:hypothetical protein